MKTVILLSFFLLQSAYSQDATEPEVQKDPAQAIKNNFAIGPYDRDGKYNPNQTQPDEKYEKQAMEETPELMKTTQDDNN